MKTDAGKVFSSIRLVINTSASPSIWKGDWDGALLNVVGIIPLVGDGIKGVSKGTQIAAKMKQVDIAIKAAKVRLVRTKMGLSVSDIKKTQTSTTDAAKNCAVQRCLNKRDGRQKKNKEIKIGNQTYIVDKKGRTVKAVGEIDGSHKNRKKKYVPEPSGGRTEGDHRGHLIPEEGVNDVTTANVKPNVISENPQSNLGIKKKFDLKASKTKDQLPESKITTEHTPRYRERY